MDLWNHKGIHGAAIVSKESLGSMEPFGDINGYMTYLTDFKCFYYKNVSRNWQCIPETALWIHGYIYHHDDVYTQKFHY